MVQKLEDRPPYVMFEKRAEEDREASIKAGHFVARDVDYVIITPAGSKDRIERVVKDWLAKLEQDVREERFPAEWHQAYLRGYAHWRETQEIPLDGTDIRNWPVLSPAQVKTLQAMNIRTVEALASCTEEAIMRLGMGGRALKQQAMDYLQNAQGPGKITMELANLRAELENSKVRMQALEERNRLLEAAAHVAMQAQPAHSESISADDILGDKL